MYKYNYFCRWCGMTYTPPKYTGRDGFCCTKHKQAHHRAYKAYVTGKKDPTGSGGSDRAGVTQKCRKK